ncbi:MAG: hypothetical protein IPL42_07635 [Saprospiraceae bacterium]|nr:hypothetical protein [Saprospiraceae bacterium]
MQPAFQFKFEVLSILIFCQFVAFSQTILSPENKLSIDIICESDKYKSQIEAYTSQFYSTPKDHLKSRSNNGNFELHIYVDTSYERKRTGSYNKNDSVVNYLKVLVDSIRGMFDSSAPNWDFGTDIDFVFFDGATPFSYGISTVETLINFTNWLDINGFPGNDDNYILYTGHYTNVGVSFLGVLCAPAIALVGFVSNFNSNVDLSSHEWIGHSCNSNHYNTEPNIMNSIASRPWNTASLQVIEDFLENQTCVENIQAPLAFTFEEFEIDLMEDIVKLYWSFNSDIPIQYFEIEQKTQKTNWKQIANINNLRGQYQYFKNQLFEPDTYYYRIKAYLEDLSVVQSEIKAVHFKTNESLRIVDFKLINSEQKKYIIYDALGRIMMQSNIKYFDLKQLNFVGLIFISSGQQKISFVL